MTYHKKVSENDAIAQPGQRLECHYCGFRRTVPKVCPKCESEHLYFLGAGSQQGEERLQELFPSARIGRMDRDTVRGRSDMGLPARRHAAENCWSVPDDCKGARYPGVTLVGVIGADFQLGLPDFRAAACFNYSPGIGGRRDLREGALQTYHPDHYAIQLLRRMTIRVCGQEMNYRQWMHYPPFAMLANVLKREIRRGYGVDSDAGALFPGRGWTGTGARAGSR
jgi:primosomal protein N' (replication factor Y)